MLFDKKHENLEQAAKWEKLQSELKQFEDFQKEVLGKLAQRLDKLDVLDSTQIQNEIVTLGVNAYDFGGNGYDYNAFFVGDSGDGEQITIELGNVSYTQTLFAGVNQLNLPDAARLTKSMGAALTVTLVRSSVALTNEKAKPSFKVQEPFAGSANTTKVFAKNCFGFTVANDGAADLTFTIGANTVTVKAGESFDGEFKPFKQVDIVATGAFRAYGRG